MNKKNLIAIPLALCMGLSLAAGAAASDKKKTDDAAPAVAAVWLGDYPAADSAAFAADIAAYRKGKEIRAQGGNETRARFDAFINESTANAAANWSEVMGYTIDKETTPETWKLFKTISKARKAAIGKSLKATKAHYNRTRPFAYFKETSCTPEHEEKLLKSPSYPSGHSALGWYTALILAQVNPERSEAILARGKRIGQSRVICGVHWQSDVVAGREFGSMIAVALMADPKVASQIAKAREEAKKLLAK